MIHSFPSESEAGIRWENGSNYLSFPDVCNYHYFGHTQLVVTVAYGRVLLSVAWARNSECSGHRVKGAVKRFANCKETCLDSSTSGERRMRSQCCLLSWVPLHNREKMGLPLVLEEMKEKQTECSKMVLGLFMNGLIYSLSCRLLKLQSVTSRLGATVCVYMFMFLCMFYIDNPVTCIFFT